MLWMWAPCRFKAYPSQGVGLGGPVLGVPFPSGSAEFGMWCSQTPRGRAEALLVCRATYVQSSLTSSLALRRSAEVSEFFGCCACCVFQRPEPSCHTR